MFTRGFQIAAVALFGHLAPNPALCADFGLLRFSEPGCFWCETWKLKQGRFLRKQQNCPIPR